MITTNQTIGRMYSALERLLRFCDSPAPKPETDFEKAVNHGHNVLEEAREVVREAAKVPLDRARSHPRALQCQECHQFYDIMILPFDDIHSRIEPNTGLKSHKADDMIVRCPHCGVHQ